MKSILLLCLLVCCCGANWCSCHNKNEVTVIQQQPIVVQNVVAPVMVTERWIVPVPGIQVYNNYYPVAYQNVYYNYQYPIVYSNNYYYEYRPLVRYNY